MAQAFKIGGQGNNATGLCLGGAWVRVTGQRRLSGGSLVVAGSLAGAGLVALLGSLWFGLVVLPSAEPKPEEKVAYIFRVTGSDSQPVPGVVVVGRGGGELGETGSDGLVTVIDIWSSSAWYFKPPFDVLAAQQLGKTPVLLQGRWVEAADAERRAWLRQKQPVGVVLSAVLGTKGGDHMPPANVSSGHSPIGLRGWLNPDPWVRIAEEGKRAVSLRTPTIVEEDLVDGSDAGSVPASEPGAGGLGEQVQVSQSSSGSAEQAAATDLALFRLGQEARAQGQEPQERGDPITGKDGAQRPTGTDDRSSVAVSAAGASGERHAALPVSSLGALRAWDALRMVLAKELSSSGKDNTAPAPSSETPRGEQAKASVGEDPKVQGPALAMRYPPDLSQMNGWVVPAALVREIHLEIKRGHGSVSATPGARESFSKIFAISTTKGAELLLGEVAGSGTLSLKIPESLRLDVLRVEHAYCGGLVVPLLASSRRSPQVLGCPGSDDETSNPFSTLAVVYESHGLRRYFVGGHLEASGGVGDVGTKVSLFRLHPGVAAGGESRLRFLHPDVEGGAVELNREVVPLVSPRVDELLSALKQDFVSKPKLSSHRVFLVSPQKPVRPRVSLRFDRGRSPQRMDTSLVDRFERALQASFVNAKAFVPVPWSTLERQSGISWTLALQGQGGWKGTVLDYLLDYFLSVVPEAEGVTATWFDRYGIARSRRTHAYLDGVPPELLARDVFDVALEQMPQSPPAQTATR